MFFSNKRNICFFFIFLRVYVCNANLNNYLKNFIYLYFFIYCFVYRKKKFNHIKQNKIRLRREEKRFDLKNSKMNYKKK